MPSIAKRGDAMPASPIRKLVPFAEAAKKRGTKVYHLNIGQPDIETPPAMLEAVRNAHIKVLEYSHSAGFESYRKKSVSYYERFGITLNHNQIMITTGGSEAILFGMMACLDMWLIGKMAAVNGVEWSLLTHGTQVWLTTLQRNQRSWIHLT